MAGLFFSGAHETGFRRGRTLWIAAAALAATAAIGAPAAHADSASCSVSFPTVHSFPGGFTAEGKVVNTSATPLTGWRVSWTFTRDEKLFSLLTTSWTQTGRNVTATNVSWNGAIAPGGSVNITAVGNSTGGTFGLSNVTCTPL
ncbi:cellulose binding domain-containing protein [Microbispora sp. H10836]|uniref:cellulose binding domain-containing protein n=1 Tax=Microbispora sp. H10836 TaxID=2729106 RepID=UPI0014762CF1|nr:cellulose binding domain-containing protein [Microbispora sp. H10836]